MVQSVILVERTAVGGATAQASSAEEVFALHSMLNVQYPILNVKCPIPNIHCPMFNILLGEGGSDSVLAATT